MYLCCTFTVIIIHLLILLLWNYLGKIRAWTLHQLYDYKKMYKTFDRPRLCNTTHYFGHSRLIYQFRHVWSLHWSVECYIEAKFHQGPLGSHENSRATTMSRHSCLAAFTKGRISRNTNPQTHSHNFDYKQFLKLQYSF